MSISYLVHKKDADSYDSIQKEYEPYYKKYDLEIGQEQSITDFKDKESVKSYRFFCDELSKKYNMVYKEITTRHGYPNGVPTVSIFDTKPKDLHNYYTYYRARRWGEAAGCKMNKIHEDGMNKIKKALENK